MIDFSLYLISDRTRCAPLPLPGALARACRAGVRAVQVREKDLSPSALLPLVRAVRAALAPYPASVLVNDRADVARAAGVEGVHLPEDGLPPDAARPCLPEGALVGVSTHSMDGARRAEERGADFILFGPVFATPSKASYGPPQGLDALKQVTQAVHLPVFAVGGITPDRARPCLDAGARGVAVISAVLAAPDIPRAVAAFKAAMGRL